MRSLPNIASTAMNARNRRTILAITSQSVAREFRTLLDGAERVPRQARTEARQERAPLFVAAEGHLVSETLFHRGDEMSDMICQPDIHGTLPDPDLAGEEIRVVGELVAATVLDMGDEGLVQLTQKPVEAGHVFLVLGAERVEHGFRLARRMDAPFDPLSLQEHMRSEPCGNHAHRPEDRTRICIYVVRRARDPVATGGRHVLDESVDRNLGLLGKTANA